MTTVVRYPGRREIRDAVLANAVCRLGFARPARGVISILSAPTLLPSAARTGWRKDRRLAVRPRGDATRVQRHLPTGQPHRHDVPSMLRVGFKEEEEVLTESSAFIGASAAEVDSYGLGRLQRISHPRMVWSSESAEFTPWLAANLDVLAEELELPLTLEAIEVPVGDFRLDIQARGPDERIVIIENQLERTDHGHLGQLLAYAAGLDAATVVWVAPEFREDHRRTLDFLNEKTTEGLDFFGVEISVVRIANQGPPAPVFEVVSRPNDWSKAVKAISAGVAATGPSSAYSAMHQFFSDVFDQVLKMRPSLRKPKPQNQNWAAFAGGPFGNFNLAFGADKRLRVEAYLDNVDGAFVTMLFDEFHATAEAWQGKVGVPLQWERLDNRRASRIVAYGNAFDLEDEAARSAAMQWAAATTMAFLTSLEPALRSRAQQLKAAAAYKPPA